MELPIGSSYEEICKEFSWQIPEYFNIADSICDRWAEDEGRLAITHEDHNQQITHYTFSDLRSYANQMANLFGSLGVSAGDRALIVLTQGPECAISHIACFKSGIVSCLASVLFGPDGLQHRLEGSRAKICITDSNNLEKIKTIRAGCPHLKHVIVIDGDGDLDSLSFWKSIDSESDQYCNIRSHSEDIAWINYTSGTTGLPKGVMMPHRVLLGNVPLFQYYYDYFPKKHDVLWSPADWAWVAGFVDIFLMGLHAGCPVVTTAMKGFDAKEAFRILVQHKVTVSLLPPTVLKLMRQVDVEPAHNIDLRVVLSGGEAVGKELAEWADKRFGLVIAEGFGQTECNGMIGTNPRLMEVRHGSLGKPMPGFVCKIIDDKGVIVQPGVRGNIAVQRPHPAMFAGYLDDPKATAEKFIGDWMISGDLGEQDEDGYLWFHGRIDDVITSSGYRIGPSEIEDCLLKSDAVQSAAVVGVPDAQRTEVVKAFIILADGYTASEELADALKDIVRQNLARHEVPRIVEFVDKFPMSTTGKILRRELRGR